MAVYQPPTENLSKFNSAVFNSANTESLSLSKAQTLFLGRTGNPTSIASATVFNNSITAGSGLFNGNVNLQSNQLQLGNIKLSSNPTYDYINFTSSFTAGNQSNSIAIGTGTTSVSANSIAIGQDCKATGYGSNICIGNSANVDVSTAGNNLNCICIGNSSNSNGADDYQIAIGTNSSCNGLNSSIAIGRNSNVAANSGGSNVALGYGASVNLNGVNSMALGSNSSATLANQIVLGTATEFVLCKGTSSTNGSLQLDGPLRLKIGTYSTPTANMLGYQISLTAVAIASITSSTTTGISIGSIALTAGVWSINYTFELLAATATVNTVAQSFYFSNTNNGAYSTRIANTGSTRIHNPNVYNVNDTPSFSGGGCLYTSGGQTIYPTLVINFSSGSLSGTGWANATRIG